MCVVLPGKKGYIRSEVFEYGEGISADGNRLQMQGKADTADTFCNPSIWEAAARGLEFQGCAGPHSKLDFGLTCMAPSETLWDRRMKLIVLVLAENMQGPEFDL